MSTATIRKPAEKTPSGVDKMLLPLTEVEFSEERSEAISIK